MSYRVLVADEAIEDIFNLVRYIYRDLCNPDAADKLYYDLYHEVENMGDFPMKFSDTGIRYRGHIIHKKVYNSYLIFYIVNKEKQEVYVLRIIKDLMEWQNLLNRTNIYHFSNDIDQNYDKLQ